MLKLNVGEGNEQFPVPVIFHGKGKFVVSNALQNKYFTSKIFFISNPNEMRFLISMFLLGSVHYTSVPKDHGLVFILKQ